MNTNDIDLSRPGQIRDLLHHAGFRPSAVMGQNFLIDRNVRDRMIEAAAVTASERVLEVGPGLGTLTAPLSDRAAQVVAVEKDKRLYHWLRERFAERSNVRFVLGDYLKAAEQEPDLLTADAMISNLPYSVAARILVMLALAPLPPRRMLVTVQKEVGMRLTGVPGTRDYGLLTVLVGAMYDAEWIRTISPTCFFPVPAVWSVVIRLRRRPESLAADRPPAWLPLVRHAFSRRRKQMMSVLLDAPLPWRPERRQAETWLQAAGIAPSARPGTVGIEQWRRLALACDVSR